MGQPVPLRIIDDGDGRLDEGDRIEWVGKQLHGPQSWFDNYSVHNVYLLSASPGAHARMTDRQPNASTGSTADLRRTLHLEQENLMIRLDQRQQKPGEEPDVWQWVKLTHADPAPFSTQFDLPDLAAGGGEATHTAQFPRHFQYRRFRDSSSTNVPADHVVDILLNGKLVKRANWSGRDEFNADRQGSV